MGFPTKNDHFGVFGGCHHLRKHPYTPLEVKSSLRCYIYIYIFKFTYLSPGRGNSSSKLQKSQVRFVKQEGGVNINGLLFSWGFYTMTY